MKKSSSVLYGKTALFSGDSISFGSSDGTPFRAWAGRIADGYGLIADNASASGWAVSTIRTGRMIDQLYHAEKKDYDYVILHGGVNDAWGDGTVHAPVGAMVREYDPAYFDVNTFAGALEELFWFAREKFPTSTVGYIMNFATPEATGIGQLTDMDAYYAQAKIICEKWGVPYLDLFHDAYVNETVMAVHTTRYMADAVHPNAAGYDRLYPIIGDWMETLPAWSEALPVTDSRQGVTVPVCACDDTAGWEGTYDTRLSLVNNPEGKPALLLDGTEPVGHHVEGFAWIGAAAEHTLPARVDLSACTTVRFEFYLSHDLFYKAGQLQLELIDEQGRSLRCYFGIDWYRPGWHTAAFSLSNPDADLHTICKLRLTWFNHNACMPALQVALCNVRGVGLKR